MAAQRGATWTSPICTSKTQPVSDTRRDTTTLQHPQLPEGEGGAAGVLKQGAHHPACPHTPLGAHPCSSSPRAPCLSYGVHVAASTQSPIPVCETLPSHLFSLSGKHTSKRKEKKRCKQISFQGQSTHIFIFSWCLTLACINTAHEPGMTFPINVNYTPGKTFSPHWTQSPPFRRCQQAPAQPSPYTQVPPRGCLEATGGAAAEGGTTDPKQPIALCFFNLF